MKPLTPIHRVCILLDGPEIRQWVVVALEKAIREEGITIPLIVIQKKEVVRSILSSGQRFVSIIIVFFRRLFHTESPWFRFIPVEEVDFFRTSKCLYTQGVPIGRKKTGLPLEVIQEIKAEKIDLIFRRGFGILDGDIFHSAPWGILSYHCGNLRNYRGGNAMVEAYIRDEHFITVSVQHLTPQLDRGDLFFEVDVPIGDLVSYGAVIDRVFLVMSTSLAEAINKANQSLSPFINPVFSKGYFPLPGIASFFLLLFRFFHPEQHS